MRNNFYAVASGIILLTVFFVTVNSWAEAPGFLKARMGTLTGEIVIEGKPLPGAIVSFFNTASGPPPILGTVRRVPDMVTRTNQDGKFSVKLLPGSYFMGALVRQKGGGIGPPRPGEKFYFAHDKEGNLRSFDIKKRHSENR